MPWSGGGGLFSFPFSHLCPNKCELFEAHPQSSVATLLHMESF